MKHPVIITIGMALLQPGAYAQHNPVRNLTSSYAPVTVTASKLPKATFLGEGRLSGRTGFDPAYKNVVPPFKGVDVIKSYYTVNASGGGEITYSSGTVIKVPSNAFTDKNGNPVKGEVLIDYREFRDQADILASGIPMVYTAPDGESGNFESAGMLEMNASVNGEQVYLAPDKKIDMQFSSVDARPTFNLYAYDDANANWTELGRAGTVKDISNVYTSAYKYYVKTRNNEWGIRPYDSTSFAGRFVSNKHFYTHQKEKEFRDQRIYIDERLYKRKLVRINGIRQMKDGKVLFRLNWYTSIHPEMSAYHGLAWLTDDDITTSAFKKNYYNQYQYNDIRVVKNGDSYQLQLKSSEGIRTLDARPVYMNAKNQPIEIKNVNASRYKAYSGRLRTREKIFNKRLRKGRIVSNMIRLRSKEQREQFAWEGARRLMTQKEQGMSHEQWKAHCEELAKNEQQSLQSAEASSENIMRSLELDGFGIYNCDQIKRLSDPIMVKAKLKGKNGCELPAGTVYLVDLKINGVFSYYKSDDVTPVTFSPGSENMLITIGAGNTTAIYTPEQFDGDEFRNRERHTFHMTQPDKKITSVADIRKLMGL